MTTETLLQSDAITIGRVADGDGWNIDRIEHDFGFELYLTDESHRVAAMFGPSGALLSCDAAFTGGKVVLELDTLSGVLSFMRERCRP